MGEDEKLKRENDRRLAKNIAKTVKAAGGRALIVGGFARDFLLRREGFLISEKDLDLEVYGLALLDLKEILAGFHPTDEVGVSFAVIKIGRIDLSLPRREVKTGPRHTDFKIEIDPQADFFEASRRRDFTVNAVALDPLTGEILDRHEGLADLKAKILRAVDLKTFGEDPLRVLRAVQLSARLGFKIEDKTAKLCRKLDLSQISRERIGEEWQKMLLWAKKPSLGLNNALSLKVIEKLHPEFLAMQRTPQSKKWHPEGDVWTHTLLVADAAADLIRRVKMDQKTKLALMLAALCHDLGKPLTTEIHSDGKVTSYGHAEAGIAQAEHFLNSIAVPKEIKKRVLVLIKEHMYPVFHPDLSDAALRRLALRLHPSNIQELVWLSEVDRRGSTFDWQGFPEAEKLLRRAEALSLADQKPKPLVTGRHLMAEGITPGPKMGKIIKRLFEAQLKGEFSSVEEGRRHFKKHRAEFDKN